MTETSRAFDIARETAGTLVLEESRGSSIRSLREKAGLTQRELAGVLGTTREHVSRVENGHTEPSVDLLNRLSRAIAFTEVAREMDVTGELDDRELGRVANRLGVAESLDTLLIRGLSTLDEKRRGLLRELEES